MRLKDIVRGGGRVPKPVDKVKEGPGRLTDLLRVEAKSSEKAVVIQPPTSRRQSGLVRKAGGLTPVVHSGVAFKDGRLQRAGVVSKDTPIERAVIERQEKPDPRLQRLETGDQVLQRAVEIVGEILRAVRANAPFSISGAEDAAELLLQNLQAGDALMVHLFSGGGPAADPTREAVHVCIVSVKLGMELGYTGEELRQLGLAALLHDVGMARLPADLVEKEGPLNPVERATLGRHPEEGVQVIRALGPKYSWLAEVIFQIHERVDGSGYPQVLKGAEIHEFAQVVGLAEVYESLVHRRPYRQRLSPLEALKEILHRERSAFRDRVLKALIQALTPYPVGSLVRLNTGEIGRVVAKDTARPLRPVVAVLVQSGKRLENPVVVDLSQSPLLNVQDSLIEEPLP
ncbi:MAG: HD-GYP domain-containing protein [Candidatus Methylomirabilales bacterium]